MSSEPWVAGTGGIPSRPDQGSFRYTASGRFLKVRVKPLKTYGAYRNKGSLQITDQGIVVTGRHVFPTARRWGIGIAIVIGVALITQGAFIPGIIPLYLIVEYAVLMDGNCTVDWASVSRFAVDPRGRWLSILVDRPERNMNTISFKADRKTVRELADAIRAAIPQKEVSRDRPVPADASPAASGQA